MINPELNITNAYVPVPERNIENTQIATILNQDGSTVQSILYERGRARL